MGRGIPIAFAYACHRISLVDLRVRSDWCELIDAPDEALGLLPDNVTMTLGSAFFFSPGTSA